MGVWIETSLEEEIGGQQIVTPYVGVWIETCKLLDMLGYGSVTPYVGVWIETNIVGLLR